MKGALWLVAAAVSLGCSAAPRAAESPAPALADPGEYARFLAGGDAVVEGRAFVRTRNGGSHNAEGFPVYLDPVTVYSRGWHRSAPDPRAAAPDTLFQLARQEATAVEEGKFTFSGLAPGWYFVSTLMAWYDGSYLPQSYVLWDSVLAQPGRTVRVVLTRMR